MSQWLFNSAKGHGLSPKLVQPCLSPFVSCLGEILAASGNYWLLT